MKGIHLERCTHHIYTDDEMIPIRHPQGHMNLALKEIIKDELQNILNEDFIYAI